MWGCWFAVSATVLLLLVMLLLFMMMLLKKVMVENSLCLKCNIFINFDHIYNYSLSHSGISVKVIKIFCCCSLIFLCFLVPFFLLFLLLSQLFFHALRLLHFPASLSWYLPSSIYNLSFSLSNFFSLFLLSSSFRPCSPSSSLPSS